MSDALSFRVDLGEGAMLRRLTMEDLETVWSLVAGERDRLGVWMPWVATNTSIDVQRSWFERVLANPVTLDGCGIWDGGIYAGGVGLGWDTFEIVGELGYWLGREFEGRGLVTRACRALIDHGFGELGLHRIAIRAGVENVRSRAVAERLGFRLEGVHRGEGRGSAGFYDLAVYGLLEDDWQKV